MSQWRPKDPPNRKRPVVRRDDDPSATAKDGRYQDLLGEVMQKTDAECAILIVLGGNRGAGFQSAFKSESTEGNAEVPHLLRKMADLMDADRRRQGN